MKRSVLTLRQPRFVALRPELVEVCDGNPAAALLLAAFDFHTAARHNDAAHREAHGDDPHPMGLWIRASYAWLATELGGAFGDRAIRSALDIVIGKGFLAKQANPEKKLDRALWYRLEVDVVERSLAQVSIPAIARMDTPNAGGMDTVDRSDHAGARSDGEPDRDPPVSPPGDKSEIDIVWEHYVKVFNATRQTLDSNRRTIIRNALKVRSVEECCRAIDGLKVSPFHNGENDQKKSYLGIQYALKGRNGESHDERIDKMIDEADKRGGGLHGGKLPTDHPRVARWLEYVRYAWSNQAEKQRGREGLNNLRANGFDVRLLEGGRVELFVREAA